jgi:hypothetical protein
MPVSITLPSLLGEGLGVGYNENRDEECLFIDFSAWTQDFISIVVSDMFQLEGAIT